jgi:hypothetical protein
MARERYIPQDPSFDQNIVTSGGSGFGLMAIVSGMSRGYFKNTRSRTFEHHNFLNTAFSRCMPHWINGTTGHNSFGTKDNGGDLVETSFLVAGMITVREYFKTEQPEEKAVAQKFDALWKGWTGNGTLTIKISYSGIGPNYNWEMNFPLEGYNECLITYVMAASSPSHMHCSSSLSRRLGKKWRHSFNQNEIQSSFDFKTQWCRIWWTFIGLIILI